MERRVGAERSQADARSGEDADTHRRATGTSRSRRRPLPPSLMLMPTAGWTLDSGAMITTDSNDVLVLRPLTSGRPSLPGQGQGWRAAYYYPDRTSRWQNYTLGVTVTNLGAAGVRRRCDGRRRLLHHARWLCRHDLGGVALIYSNSLVSFLKFRTIHAF